MAAPKGCTERFDKSGLASIFHRGEAERRSAPWWSARRSNEASVEKAVRAPQAKWDVLPR